MRLLDIANRGDEDFESLSEIEKDIYVLSLFQVIYEMEGYTHFFSTYRNTHVPRLVRFLEAIEAPNRRWVIKIVNLVSKQVSSWDPDDVDKYFCEISEELSDEVDEWGLQYYAGVNQMWKRVDEYLMSQGLSQIDAA